MFTKEGMACFETLKVLRSPAGKQRQKSAVGFGRIEAVMEHQDNTVQSADKSIACWKLAAWISGECVVSRLAMKSVTLSLLNIIEKSLLCLSFLSQPLSGRKHLQWVAELSSSSLLPGLNEILTRRLVRDQFLLSAVCLLFALANNRKRKPCGRGENFIKHVKECLLLLTCTPQSLTGYSCSGSCVTKHGKGRVGGIVAGSWRKGQSQDQVIDFEFLSCWFNGNEGARSRKSVARRSVRRRGVSRIRDNEAKCCVELLQVGSNCCSLTFNLQFDLRKWCRDSQQMFTSSKAVSTRKNCQACAWFLNRRRFGFPRNRNDRNEFTTVSWDYWWFDQIYLFWQIQRWLSLHHNPQNPSPFMRRRGKILPFAAQLITVGGSTSEVWVPLRSRPQSWIRWR